jgi:hypothetical protein
MAVVKVGPHPIVAEGPQSALERRLIAQYLLSKGYRMPDLACLPEHTAKSLMKQACLYAALKLAEIESRARLCREIED